MDWNLAEAQKAEWARIDAMRARCIEWGTRTRTAALMAVVNPFTPKAKAQRLLRLLNECERLACSMPDHHKLVREPFDVAHHLLAVELMY